ncbi:hypothetical protein CL628_04440 [bacterium]|nr:hypothetical protein [bacterium]
MCFSATASFVAGGALSTVGVATLKKVKVKTDIPYASITLFFGLQQLAEGVIWLSLMYQAAALNIFMTYVYVMFAYVLWPTLIPASVFLLETVRWRRKVLRAFFAVGAAISLYLIYILAAFPVSSQIGNNHIVYAVHQIPIPWIIGVIFYVAVTCISALFSSHRLVNLFGALVLVSLIGTLIFYTQARVSVWCFFAALVSIAIYFFIRGRTKSSKHLEVAAL